MRDRGMASKKSSSVWWLDLEFTRQVSDFVDYDGNPLKTVDDEAPRD
jgi:putative DNA primase/helicase